MEPSGSNHSPRLWKQFKKNRVAVLSLLFLVILTLAALFAPYVTRFSFEEQNIMERLQSPSAQHWMGTDALGRDLYSRIIYGARMSLAVGAATAFIALIIGTSIGITAGYFGGWTDRLLMRMVELFTIFPSVLLAILLMLLVGRGFLGVLLGLGFGAWVSHARLIRGQVLLIRELTFIEAARALGVSQPRIMLFHVLPNLWGPILVSITIQIPTQIMTESFLSFMGLGLQPPYSSWGTLANEGFRAIQSYPYLMVFPGGILFLTLLAFNYLGEGLKDLVETRLDQRLMS
jgi:oligopeptide transport system permease protein